MSTTYNPYRAPKSEFTEVQLESDDVELATIPHRILARVIDYCILGTIAVVVAMSLMLVALFVIGFNEENLEALDALIPTWSELYRLFTLNLFNPWVWGEIIITHLIFLAIQGVLLHRHGQTIGKKLLRLAIVDADTHKLVPLPRLFLLRYLIWDIPALFFTLIYWVIRTIDLCFGLREDRRTLHDMTANTIVIKVQH